MVALAMDKPYANVIRLGCDGTLSSPLCNLHPVRAASNSHAPNKWRILLQSDRLGIKISVLELSKKLEMGGRHDMEPPPVKLEGDIAWLFITFRT